MLSSQVFPVSSLFGSGNHSEKTISHQNEGQRQSLTIFDSQQFVRSCQQYRSRYRYRRGCGGFSRPSPSRKPRTGAVPKTAPALLFNNPTTYESSISARLRGRCQPDYALFRAAASLLISLLIYHDSDRSFHITSFSKSYQNSKMLREGQSKTGGGQKGVVGVSGTTSAGKRMLNVPSCELHTRSHNVSSLQYDLLCFNNLRIEHNAAWVCTLPIVVSVLLQCSDSL